MQGMPDFPGVLSESLKMFVWGGGAVSSICNSGTCEIGNSIMNAALVTSAANQNVKYMNGSFVHCPLPFELRDCLKSCSMLTM